MVVVCNNPNSVCRFLLGPNYFLLWRRFRIGIFFGIQDIDRLDHVEGEGLIIEYHAKKSLLHLIQKAKLTQGNRLFTGDRINYDSAKSVITGRGTPKTQQQSDTPPKRNRVKVIIPPKKTTP